MGLLVLRKNCPRLRNFSSSSEQIKVSRPLYTRFASLTRRSFGQSPARLRQSSRGPGACGSGGMGAGGSSHHEDDDDEGDAFSRMMEESQEWRQKKDWQQAQLAMQEAIKSEMKQQEQNEAEFAAALTNTGPAPVGNLITLSYASILATHPKCLAQVCAAAMRNNPPAGIGGVMGYHEPTSTVTQILEGPETMVRWLFAKIENDPRHHSVRLLHMAELSGGERQHDVGMRFMLGHVPGYTPSDDDLSSNGTSEASSSDDPASPGVCDVAGPSQDHPWLRLTYASVLSVKTRRVAFNLIGAVVHTAVHNNPRLGIGGVLLLNARTLPYKVVQVLEGPEPAVRALFRTIERDLRHEHCTLIMEERLLTEGQRRFFEWGMRQADFTDWGSLMQTSQSVHGGNLFNSAGAEHLFAPGADAKVALSKLMRWEQEVVVLQAAIEANAPSSALKQAAERRPSRGAKYFANTPGSAPLTAASTGSLMSPRAPSAAPGNQARNGVATTALRAARDAFGSPRLAARLSQPRVPSSLLATWPFFASHAKADSPPHVDTTCRPRHASHGMSQQQPGAEGIGKPPKTQAQAGSRVVISALPRNGTLDGVGVDGSPTGEGEGRRRPLRAGSPVLKLPTDNLNALKALEDHVEELAAAEKNTKQQQIASADVIEEARMAAVLQQQQQLTPLGGGSSIKRRAKVQVAGA